jgi:hypothetical protein
LQELLRGFDPGLWSGDDCAAIADELALLEKACATARVRASERAVACNAHRRRGFGIGAEWMARTVGSSAAEARVALATVAAAAECPATREAIEAGQVSFAQAREIVAAEAAVPGSERALLEVAATSGSLVCARKRDASLLGAVDRGAPRRTAPGSGRWLTGSTTWMIAAGSGSRPRWACAS